MRKIVYHIAISVDGFIAHRDGAVTGFLMEGAHADAFVQSLSQYDTVIMGSNTYAFGFQFGLQAGEPAYAGMKHIIVSRSLQFDSTEQVERVSTNVVARVQQLKQTAGKGIWLCGGGHLAGFLLNHSLIDEVWLKVNPIILGNGIGLFEGVQEMPQLTYYDGERYDNGVLLHRYKVDDVNK